MNSPVSFRLLGPLEIVVGGEALPPTAGKQRTILAALLLRPNRSVPVEALIDKLWDCRVPDDARGTVQKYVMRLRRLLDGAGVGGEMIRTDPNGYRITVAPGQIDVDRFTELSAAGVCAGEAGDAAAESALLAEALELWSAVPPLANVPSVSLHRHEAAGLVERYLRALDRRIEADLRLARHADLIAELTGLVRQYPERERFWAQRMRALHRCGRQGEALASYREVVALLAEEYGVDPGTELQTAHREILMGPHDESMERAHPTPPSAVGTQPRQLPRGTVGFVGRHAELARAIDAVQDAPVVITGSAGIGKTALVVQAAHRVTERFPDGQLFADMRGSAAGPALSAGDALAGFLRALGAPPGVERASEDDQIMTYRSLLAGRRMLVVLDDVADAAQVRALLPGSSECGVLITSRHDLTQLIVSPGAHRVILDELTSRESHQLLAGLLGASRAETDPVATDELVEMCGGSALALRVAAAHVTRHPGLRMADYVAQLHSTDPLAALRADDDELTNLAATFAWSYRLLTPGHRKLLHLLSRRSDGDLTVGAAAELAGLDVARATAAMEALAAANLLERLPSSRYRMHELLREHLRRRSEPDVHPLDAGRTASPCRPG